VRHYGNFETAEDAVQEALLAAATQWPARGVPDSPSGWLITVASRRMTDQLRSERAGRQREEMIASRTPPDTLLAPGADAEGPRDEDDTLILLWHRESIDEGISLITRTLAEAPLGPYQLQAAIAAVHGEAARAEDTDWPQIVELYRLLEDLAPNPMVALGHAVAVAMVRGPRAARLTSSLPEQRYLHGRAARLARNAGNLPHSPSLTRHRS
jgi:predicted RNA polymerase sigma factor